MAVLTIAGFSANAAPVYAGVDVNVNVGLPVGVVVAPDPIVVAPQPVYIEQPPEMVFIPRSNVYFAPGVSVDLFFYDNRGWNRRGDRWYRANAYNGPWTVVGPRYVPARLFTGFQWVIELSTSMRSAFLTDNGRRATGNTTGGTKSTSTATGTGTTTIRGKPRRSRGKDQEVGRQKGSCTKSKVDRPLETGQSP